ncbi:N-formylglutamate amidohydrolase [Qipengyuania qiaonensis]|uniref:N-formylglutamate amidohydrolase n=1 Tax=Qipengyuania qiaonensis TaxID=2867240 RepID=A0ABS7J0W3_9SPHN|nr:N-formylglutamate amidohydrolase [Qipengyuania qiaonensis]MBX7480980.1 N-formylglutamate amidohydrolase [Qipengyuania qiaonensis]
MREWKAEPARGVEHLTGGEIPGHHAPAYHLWRSDEDSLPVLIASPHCGRAYPEPLSALLRDPEQASLRLEDRHVDKIARPVATATRASLLLADAPRAMIDLNRSVEDIDWSMVRGAKPRQARHSLANRRSRSGLGLVPRRVPGMGEIWRRPLEKAELDAWIEGIYVPYHAALASELERLRDRWGVALLIDLHSMPPLRRTHPQDLPAEFVIGDRFGASCDPGLVDLAIRYLAAHGRRVAHNRPYSGGYVLDRYGQTARGIHALQIEVCRSAYLDARLDQPTIRAAAIAKLLSGLVHTLAAEVETMGRAVQMPHAAE